ncbi:MAG: dihydrolipoyl dehydrogenase [Actinobacteria bacterium]|nr:dihydrolipoyl dehydrogenase [Actinomycetota bacterium]|tara:strand:- start:125 stop:1534 length:1410 start_codon:yes stop_codon:yes gene_type:complete
MTKNYDLVVIGGGPAGYAAALYGSAAGLEVAVVEENKIGGTCLHVGCIPAKELLETASVLRTVRQAKDFGIETSQEPVIDLSISQNRKQTVIDQLFTGLNSLLTGREVTIYSGKGFLSSDQKIEIKKENETEIIQGKNVLLATGSTPRTIEGFEIDGEIVMTSDEFLSLENIPDRVAVIGGGAIGCEFASLLNDLGSAVTLLESLDEILPGCDKDISTSLRRSFSKKGIDVQTGVKVEGHERKEQKTTVSWSREGDVNQIEVDLVVISVGRQPNGHSAGLQNTEVEVDQKGFIEVDERLKTKEQGVWAAGDVINTPQLAHLGFAEGIFAVKEILGENPVPIDPETVPWCIYCDPEVAFAGLTEEKAKAAGYEVTVSKHRYSGNGRAMIIGETDGLVKVVAEKNANGKAGRILGVHMVGPWVTEQLGQAYLAVNLESTVDEVANHIQAHPTLSELFGETVMSLTGRSLHG